MPAAAVVIAAHNLMPALKDRVKVDGHIVAFPDTEPIQALQTIIEEAGQRTATTPLREYG